MEHGIDRSLNPESLVPDPVLVGLVLEVGDRESVTNNLAAFH